jgi:hypothetical protein
MKISYFYGPGKWTIRNSVTDYTNSNAVTIEHLWNKTSTVGSIKLMTKTNDPQFLQEFYGSRLHFIIVMAQEKTYENKLKNEEGKSSSVNIASSVETTSWSWKQHCSGAGNDIDMDCFFVSVSL